MSINIIGEDFTLTDAIKTQVEEKIKKLQEHMRKECEFTVFLKKDGPYDFEVKFQTHYEGQDFVSQSKDKDFYIALNAAKKGLLRQLDDVHARKVRERRHSS